MATIQTRVRLKKDTHENWEDNGSLVLLDGEMAIEGNRNYKIGDGTTEWADLPYANSNPVLITSSSLTLNASHAECFLSCSTSMQITIPSSFVPVGTQIEIYNSSGNTIALLTGAGVTINGKLISTTQYEVLTLKQINTNTWLSYTNVSSGGGGSSVDVEPLNITENGTYTAPEGKAYSPVTVNVPNTYSQEDEGKVVDNGTLVEQTSIEITQNGTVDTTLNNEVVVNVPTAILEALSVTENGTYTPAAGHGYNSVNVNVQSGGGESKLVKVVSDAENYSLSAQDLIGTTRVRDFAFRDARKLTSIEIPSGVTYIGNDAFENCVALTSIDLPSSITSIGRGVFYVCESLRSIKLPERITSIGASMFFACRALTIAEIPSGVTTIGYNAFYNCQALATIILRAVNPPSLNNANVFYGIPANTRIYVPDESVETYKTAQYWSTYASRIHPLSEYTPS